MTTTSPTPAPDAGHAAETIDKKGHDVNLTDDEQVLFDVREAIAGANRSVNPGYLVGDHGAEDAIRRMLNMGLVVRRAHPRRSPEPDLTGIIANHTAPARTAGTETGGEG